MVNLPLEETNKHIASICEVDGCLAFRNMGWTRCEDGMPEDGQECLIWHVLGDSSRSPHAIDIASWLNGKWIFPWDRPKLNNPPQWVRAWRPQVLPPVWLLK